MLLILGGTLVADKWPDIRANWLFADATRLIQDAQTAEKNSYVRALKHYEMALQKGRYIIQDYPSSSIAMKLAQPQGKLGPYAISEWEDTILPRIKERAEIEGDPLGCALFISNHIKDNGQQVAAFVTIAKVYLTIGQVDKHNVLVEKALKIAEGMPAGAIHDLYSKGEALATVAQAYADTGHIDRALQIARSIIDAPDYTQVGGNAVRNVNFKAAALSSIADSYVKAGQHNKALQLIEQEIADSAVRSREKARILGDVADKYIKSGKLEEALNIASGIEYQDVYPVPKYEALAKIAIKHAETGALDRAMQVANEIEGDSKHQVLVEVASGYAKAGQLDQALSIANRMKGANYWRFNGYPWAMAKISQSYAQAGDFDKAIANIQLIGDASDKNRALVSLVRGYAESGKPDLALQVAEMIEGPERDDALGIVAGTYGHMGDVDKALRLIEVMGELTKPNALVKLVEIYLQDGRIDQALAIITNGLRVPQKKRDALAKVAAYYARTGQKGKSKELLGECIRMIDAEEYGRNYYKNEIAKSYIQEDLLDLALYVVNTFDTHGKPLHPRESEKATYQALALAEIGSKYKSSTQDLNKGRTKLLHDIIASYE